MSHSVACSTSSFLSSLRRYGTHISDDIHTPRADGKYSGVVGFLGFNHDRKLALRALAVSAAKTDVHAVFAGSVSSIRGLRLISRGPFTVYRS